MFFIVIAAILGLINYYVFRTAAVAYPQFSVFFATFTILCFASPFVGRFLRVKQWTKASLPFNWIGFTWLGICGIALLPIALCDTAQLLGAPFTDRQQFLAISGLTALIAAWGAYSAKRPTVRNIKIESPKLGVPANRIRIAQISDLHLGDSSSRRFVRKLVEELNARKPDIIVSTGDLFDGYLDLLAPYVDLLRELEAPLGKFAISGNHEVYAGLEECMSLTEVAGFKTLRNESLTLPISLTLIGVEDPESPNKANEADLLRSGPEETFKALLKHRPAFNKDSRGRFDLQLSGHTHGGQIFPFHLLTKLQYRIGPGLSVLGPNQRIYVSRGTGSWGPQIRFLAPPEITVFDISGQE